MDALSRLLALPAAESEARGLAHTPREIAQQPATWRGSRARLLRAADDVREFLGRAGLFDEAGGGPPAVLLVGAGTSDYIGRALADLMRRSWRCEVTAVPSTDLLTSMDDLLLPGREYLFISFSRSGDSSEGVAVIESALARHARVRHLVVTCNERGRMAREFGGRDGVHALVLDDAVNDRGLAMTSSFTNMVVAGHCLAHARDPDAYAAVLDELIGAAREFIPAAADAAARLAAGRFSRVCFLGTGPLKAAAVESALKVLELTAGRIVTFAESFLGLRHGPLSALDGETLVVGYLSADARRRAYELDLIGEVAAKGLARKCLVVAPLMGGRAEARATPEPETITLNFRGEVADLYRPPVDVIFGQLFGLFASLEAGLKPDAPSPSGAICRVVSQVKIH